MRGSLRVRKSKSFRLAPVGLHSGIAIKHEGELAFLEGFALDRFVVFAGDGIAQVIVDGGNTPDIACRWFAFESHDSSSLSTCHFDDNIPHAT